MFEEYMGDKKAIEFKTDALRTPGVYMWCKGDKAIYIGSATNILPRCFSAHHAKSMEFQEVDHVFIFPCVSLEAAKAMESWMISVLLPEHNQRNKRVHKARKLAKALGVSPTSVDKLYFTSGA